VLSGEELLYYAVKTIRRRGSASEILSQARQIVSRLIADFEPECLAIERMFFIHKSAALLNVTADEIKAVANAAALPIYEYAPTVVRKMICCTGRASKTQVAKVLAAKYPELARYLGRRSKWETLYYANIFDAIAVGLCCQEQMSKAAAASAS
jgi:crossover junction endodeoxyribonuclease RuvC